MFVCSSCGHNTPKWLGKCPECEQWNTFEQTAAPQKSSKRSRAGLSSRTGHAAHIAHQGNTSSPVRIQHAAAASADNATTRISTAFQEFDRVLGGSLTRNSIVLISGEPGIGKSTLLLQAAANLQEHGTVLYICAEESPEQVGLRARRLGFLTESSEPSLHVQGTPRKRSLNASDDDILLTSEYMVEKLEEEIRRVQPTFVIVDSIQTLRSDTLGNLSGRTAHISACAAACCQWAREYGTTVFLIAHVTKDGTIAGPKLIEHMVDTVLMFESSKNNVRFLYSNKNRYGTTDEVGIFKMTSEGLTDVRDAGKFFLEEREGPMPAGICVAAMHEGSRPFLVELQALTIATSSQSRVFSERVDSRQISRIAAVLERHAGLPLSDHNIYVNVAGGIRIQEPGAELALMLSLYSAYKQHPVSKNVCAIGEVSLAGEIRPVEHFTQRCRQAIDYGFSVIIVPYGNVQSYCGPSSNYLSGAKTIAEAIQLLSR